MADLLGIEAVGRDSPRGDRNEDERIGGIPVLYDI